MSPRVPTDSEIIEASAEDPAAFEQIFDRHFDPIARYLRGQVGPDDGDELVGEVFLIAFRRRADFDLARPSAKPWLFGVAGNLVRSRRGAVRKQAEIAARLDRAPEHDRTSEIERRVDARAARPELLDALANLPPQEREALLMFSWGELTYAEIAEALEVELGTVRSRISRARTRMQQQLGDELAQNKDGGLR